MGYLDKTTQTVTAHFTKRGRELLADALAGNTSGDYIITKWALGDDEIDYSLYDESQPTNLRGRVIENMPVVESPVHDSEVMNYFIVHPPPVALQTSVTNIPAQIELTGKNDVIDVSPLTENLYYYDEEQQAWRDDETYKFELGADNLVDMYDINNPPVSDFIFAVDSQGSPVVGTPPVANFNYNVVTETTPEIPPGWNAGSGPPPGVI